MDTKAEKCCSGLFEEGFSFAFFIFLHLYLFTVTVVSVCSNEYTF